MKTNGQQPESPSSAQPVARIYQLHLLQEVVQSVGMNAGPGRGGAPAPPSPALIHQLSNSGIEIPSTWGKTGGKSRVAVAKMTQQLPGGMDDFGGTATGERAFMDEKELLGKLPISRRTLGNWKTAGVIPYIKIGRRCLYDWASVQGALLRRQRGGQ
jgi:hypothetical protein